MRFFGICFLAFGLLGFLVMFSVMILTSRGDFVLLILEPNLRTGYKPRPASGFMIFLTLTAILFC